MAYISWEIDVDRISTIYKSLGHPIRVKILVLIHEYDGCTYGELSELLKIKSSGKLSFHLDKMNNLLQKDQQRRYVLNEQGRKAIKGLKAMDVDFNDPHPKVSQVNDESGFLQEIRPLHFMIIASLLGIVILPIFYIGGLLLGAVYYRLAEDRGTIELQQNFNQYVVLIGVVMIPVIIFSYNVLSIFDAAIYGGLFSLFLLGYTSTYFIGSWLYIFFSDTKADIALFPSNIVETFKWIIVLAVVGLGCIGIDVIFDPPPFFGIDRTFDTVNTYTYEVGLSIFTRFMMMATLVGFYIFIGAIQFDSIAEVMFNRGTMIVIALTVATIVLLLGLQYSWDNDISHIDSITWYGVWIAIAIVSGIATFIGQITAMRFTVS